MRASYRPVHGILLLDKPMDLSSHEAMQQARRILKAEKAGHAGTLDPMATGLLPVLFGEASKFGQAGLNAHKSYEAVIKLGAATATGDVTGPIREERPVPPLSQEDLSKAKTLFMGKGEQIPPMYSALKKNGVPLYRLARKNQTIERAARPITIHELALNQLDPEHIQIKVTCSKGTYIRTLAEDIAQFFGTLGHLTALRRTHVGSLQGQMYRLEELFAAARVDAGFSEMLLPIDAFLMDLPIVRLNKIDCQHLFQGKKIIHAEQVPFDAASEKNLVRCYTEDEKFFGLATIDSACYLQSERLVSGDYLSSILS